MHKVCCRKAIATTAIVSALTLAIIFSIISIWRQDVLGYFVYVSRFFEIMIPVLAVGALIKYLVCGSGHEYHHNNCGKH